MNPIITTENINFIMVFLQGLLSFFSPCVIPLIPIYMAYLAGGANEKDKQGELKYNKKKILFHTLFFIIGISFSFFILGFAFSSVGRFFNTNRVIFTRIGGIIIIIMGLFQLGIFEFKFLQRERRIHINFANKEVNPLIALLMGFTFSFAWTPCIGTYLSSVLVLAANARTVYIGNLLIALYALGFFIPFLLLGLFTTQVLSFLKAKKNLLKYTIKFGGALLVLMGIMTYTGWMNGISSYLNSFSIPKKNDIVIKENEEDIEKDDDINNNIDYNEGAYENKETSDVDDENINDDSSNEEDYKNEANSDLLPMMDFTLIDQYGDSHTLSDYKGKVIFLNFWATWCPPCKEEMPHIEELYKEFNLNQDEVVILGVANPKTKDMPNNADKDKEYIIEFLSKNNYTFPTVFDETGEILSAYYINSFPTTFMINKEGYVLGYIPGKMTKDMMLNIINQTLDSTN